jgi:SPASM domain peptide maturase of grasp-with-spasm system
MSNISTFKMHSNCIAVKGANRSSICDLQRNEVKLIPHDLYKLITLHEGKNIEEIKAEYEELYHDIVDEYLNFLFEHEYAFLTDMFELYPKLNTQWFESSEITNAIIDINNESTCDITSVLSQLDDLNCKNVQVRFFSITNLNRIVEILGFLNTSESIVSSVNFVVSFTEEFSIEKLTQLLKSQPRISSFMLYNHKKDIFINPLQGDTTTYVQYTTKNISSSVHCGVISQEYFAPNVKAYTEGLHHNSCLNRKIAIDVNGNIKNCPSMSQSFGTIENTTLQEALQHTDFKKYWNITKDQIDVCKDCEFRYICTDCRAYTENPDDQYSKPLKCGYDPYTNEWSAWSKNPLKQKAIVHYEMQELIKKDK